MLPVVAGDILEARKGIVVHQANARGIMGSGLAAGVRRIWPAAWEDYRDTHARRGLPLGSVVFTPVGEDLWVASVIGQDGYGRTGKHTDYASLRSGLEDVARLARLVALPVLVPWGIGCGLGGGDWAEVQSLVAEALAGTEASVVRLPGAEG